MPTEMENGDMELNADLNTQPSLKHTGNLEQIKGSGGSIKSFI